MTKQYKSVNNVLGWLVFLVASFTYLSTIEPTGSFWDCGEFIISAYKLEVGHPPGAPFFMLTANLFTQLVSDPSMVAKMVNSMSALFSALTILFLFWSITHLARRIVLKAGERELTPGRLLTVMGCGLVGALACTFSDTFWFSAVEGEVYAYSSLFTAVVFWLILKWEEVAHRPHADRWIVLIAYFMGLSIGVHLLNLLCIPAIVLVYYYKKFPDPSLKGTLTALAVSFAIVALMMYGVVQGLVEVCGWFELLFVNVFKMPYNSGVFAYVIIIAGVLAWAILETMRTKVNTALMKITFILAITLLGIPFIGSGYILGILLIIALTAGLFRYRKVNVKILNTILVSLMVIVVGYSSYALILIRSTADTPMNQNAPRDIFTLRTYLAREQYGDTPLLYGQTYVSDVKRKADGANCVPVVKESIPNWSRVIKENPKDNDRYYISYYAPRYKYAEETEMLFPRMYSDNADHINSYKFWANVKGQPVKFNRCGETVTVMKPTFVENLRFFFSYQLNYMYWRYFMWNFSGRQNDLQGHNNSILNGNYLTGIKFIDRHRLGPQDNMPYDVEHNKAHNVFYMLPLLLGLLGIGFQLFSGKKGIQSFWITFFLFFMTGIAIVLYLNQYPFQPRERDYAYAGSFYAFCIWIGLGVATVARALERIKAPETVAGLVASLACLLVPLQMVSQTWDDHDRSERYIARDFGANYLESCEPNAVIFTNGDNDTFPLWYAQEVEGIRTDVRVCNTSYLQTDWYIDQMKRQAYDSEPLPISWTRDKYIQGTRDRAWISNRIGQVDLGTALEFVHSDNPKYKIRQGTQLIDYIPSETVVYRVDSAAVVQNSAICPEDRANLLKEMTVNLKDYRHGAVGKEGLTILDMLYTNNWKRPIYFAITVEATQFIRLDPYFQKTGMAYRVTPVNTRAEGARSIDTEKMYDNVMNRFKWGGLEKPGLYLDETVMRMCKTYRMSVFGDLSTALIQEGKKEKALAVLNKAAQVLPPENVPYDYTVLGLAENYQLLGETERAEQLLNAVADYALRSIRWFFKLRPDQLVGIQRDLQLQMSAMQNAIVLGMRNNPDFGATYRDEFNGYWAEYQQMFSTGSR